MGFLSKLFGGLDKAASDMFGEEKHYFDNLNKADEPEAPKPAKPAVMPNGQPAPKQYGNLPWGDLMPAEENQYSAGGSYIDYFNRIFTEDISGYQISHAPAENGRAATIFTFTAAGRTALIVELMSERSSAYRLRNECLRNGTPYLRFYYDHHGWWNTRSYVIGRVRSKLSI